jgi:hypothetical protein
MCDTNSVILYLLGTPFVAAAFLYRYSSVHDAKNSIALDLLATLIMDVAFTSNELVTCDKELHCNFACLLYSKLINRYPNAHIINIVGNKVPQNMS